MFCRWPRMSFFPYCPTEESGKRCKGQSSDRHSLLQVACLGAQGRSCTTCMLFRLLKGEEKSHMSDKGKLEWTLGRMGSELGCEKGMCVAAVRIFKGHGIPGTCYRTEKAPATGRRKPKSPKVPGRVLGRVPGKSGLLGAVLGGRFLWKSRETALLPAVPPAVLLFPVLFPALSSALLGIWAFSVL